MFDQKRNRLWIALGWILVFGVFWLTMNRILPKEDLTETLHHLEKSVVTQNWEQANKYINELENQWEKGRLLIQINNASEDVGIFASLLSQARLLIKHTEGDALNTIGQMNEIAKSITTAFPGP